MAMIVQATSVTDNLTQQLPSPLKRQGGGLDRLGSRRARAACALCRWRKVRCDAEEGHPCSNCSFEDVQCVLTERQRRKKNHNLSKSYTPPTVTEVIATDSPFQVFKRTSPTIPVVQEQNAPAQTDTQLFSHIPALNVQPEAIQIKGPHSHHDFNAFAAPSILEPVMSRLPSVDFSVSGRTFSAIEKSFTAPIIPPYLKPLPDSLGMDDIEYLHRKGALSVPEPDLRDALLQSYIEFVHPCLPILDLQSFQDSIQNPSQYGQLSYPLFQAVMFAGAAWVDIKPLRKLGFLTRKAAQKTLYQKSRLLYDSDYEQNRLCLVQTLLLLTLWGEGLDEQKDAWYWSGLSLSVARTIGLTRDSANQTLDPSMRRLRRRLWWSVLMRDTIASFGLKRAPRIRDTDYDVAMLTVDDFNINEMQFQPTRWHVVKTVQQQRQLANICIEMAKLCRLISKILEVVFAENPLGQTGTLYLNQELNPADAHSPMRKRVDTRKLSLCEEELRKWRADVHEETLHASPTSSLQEVSEQATLLHRALLSALYFTALLSIHWPRVLTTSTIGMPPRSAGQQKQDASRAMVRYAAAQVNRIMIDLYQADLVRLLPATGISCLIPASISHISDLKCADELIRREGAQRLEECKQVLRELADAHIAAEWAINFVNFAASQGRCKGAAKRGLTGMVCGEIKWRVQRHQKPPEQAISASQLSQCGQKLVLQTENDTLATMFHTQTPDREFSELNQSANVNHFPPVNTTKMTSNSAQSLDDFSNTISFPETWLDFVGTSEAILDMNWIDNDEMFVIN